MTCYSQAIFGNELPTRRCVSTSPTGQQWSRSCQVLMQDRSMQSPRDSSMYGAVDLGARQAAAQRRQQAARAAAAASAGDGASAAAPASAFVLDVNEETFNDDVGLRSRPPPV